MIRAKSGWKRARPALSEVSLSFDEMTFEQEDEKIGFLFGLDDETKISTNQTFLYVVRIWLS